MSDSGDKRQGALLHGQENQAQSILKSHKTIINGDNRDMNLLDDRSEPLGVTSPPYWQFMEIWSRHYVKMMGFIESEVGSATKKRILCPF